MQQTLLFLLQGDTFTNTSDELKSIVSNGQFHIKVAVVDPNDDKISLQFRLDVRDSSDPINNLSADQQATHLLTWKNAEIQDFIRRLGFSKVEGNVGSFTKLNEVQPQLFQFLLIRISIHRWQLGCRGRWSCCMKWGTLPIMLSILYILNALC